MKLTGAGTQDVTSQTHIEGN